MKRLLTLATLLLTLGVAGCATLQELAALRSVAFAFDRIADVRVAGIRVGSSATYASLGVADVARLSAAVISKSVPLELTAHVRAENPAENSVTARMVDVAWALYIEDQQAIAGQLGRAVALPPGKPVDVPVSVRFDLVQLSKGGARDLFDLALGIAGVGGAAKPLRLELTPTIETSLGPITYPAPIVLRRAAG